jgi:hypothetical protein
MSPLVDSPQAEFSRMLTSILSGHTFTAKLAHEGTVLKYGRSDASEKKDEAMPISE